MPNKLEKPIDFSDFKCRASQAGKLDTDVKGGSNLDKYNKCLSEINEYEEKAKIKALTTIQAGKLSDLKAELKRLEPKKNQVQLSQTAKSYLQQVYWETRTGVKKDIYSAYMENGKMGEPLAIKLLTELDEPEYKLNNPELYELNDGFSYEKCTEPRQFNDYFQGECDIHSYGEIQDIKCCWDIDTFRKHINELLFSDELDENGNHKTKWTLGYDGVWYLNAEIENNDYYCQGVVYMELYGEDKFRLRYCLVDMPVELVEREIKKIMWDFGGKECTEMYDAITEFKRRHQFGHYPINLRVCTFKVERDVEKYQSLVGKVIAAREYLNWFSTEMFYYERPDLKPKELSNADIKKTILESNPIQLVKEKLTEKIGEVETEKLFEKINEGFDAKLPNEVIIQSTEFEVETNDVKIVQEIIKEEESENKLINELIEKGEINSEEEFNFPDDLDKITPESNQPNKIQTTTESTQETKSDDTLINTINSFDNMPDFTSWYMDNQDLIDDQEPYETIFKQKKLSLQEVKKKEDAPKVTKPKSEPKPTSPVKSEEPKKVALDPNARYEVNDGNGGIISDLSLADAQKLILDTTSNICLKYNTIAEVRDNVMVFVASNKSIIDLDIKFKEELGDVVKARVAFLMEEKKKQIQAEVSNL
jgi:hypothetical protein